MEEKKVCRNNALLVGTLVGDFDVDHTFLGEKFYKNYISVRRTSGVVDVLPIIVSGKLLDKTVGVSGSRVMINGRVSTFNVNNEDGKRSLKIYIFATYYSAGEDVEGLDDANQVTLSGYLCKAPVYRETPLGRQIADFILAVNRPYDKSDYIPCICWGRDAVWMGGFEVGEEVFVSARFQSRNYVKKQPDETLVDKVAYEFSTIALSVGLEGVVE